MPIAVSRGEVSAEDVAAMIAQRLGGKSAARQAASAKAKAAVAVAAQDAGADGMEQAPEHDRAREEACMWRVGRCAGRWAGWWAAG